VPVPRGDDEVEAVGAGELVQAAGDLVAPGDGERALGRREVILEVDDQERLGDPRIIGEWRPPTASARCS
jgi:hypothetical protein